MLAGMDLSMVNWARAQFALTAMYHWLFVPLTLGMTWLIAFFHTIYVKTGDEEWGRLTRFWMKLFGINFAIGVASGIILEFEFGTNWSNYSWMVGDIFGAPLAVEGLIAFFMETTFFAVMFFGWNRVSRGFHLFSTWMVAIGSNLSAVWILVANAWMQHPVGQVFNPENARFEMQSFADVALSPFAVNKFTHTTSSSMMTASLFIISVSSWYLLRGQHQLLAKRSIVVASVLGLIASGFTMLNGDESAYEIAQVQPMKLAAIEGLYKGESRAGITVFGVMNRKKTVQNDEDAFLFEIRLPFLLSIMATRSFDGFVPGVQDLVNGNEQQNIMATSEKMRRGQQALSSLDAFRSARKNGDQRAAATHLADFESNREFLGYGHLKTPEEAVPPVALSFYAFHVMVSLAGLILLLFAACLYFLYRGTLETRKWLLSLGVIGYFMGVTAGQAGWVVAEVGRQPWTIQGLLPCSVASTNLTAGTVQTTFFIFLVLFVALLLAEICIMLKQISIGPEEN